MKGSGPHLPSPLAPAALCLTGEMGRRWVKGSGPHSPSPSPIWTRHPYATPSHRPTAYFPFPQSTDPNPDPNPDCDPDQERRLAYSECHDHSLVGDQTLAFRLIGEGMRL